MIGKEEFEALIREHFEQEKRIDALDEIFKGSFCSPIIDYSGRLFDQLIKLYFDEIGQDWISYYLYENPEHCYYLNDKRMPLETIDDLWSLVSEHR